MEQMFEHFFGWFGMPSIGLPAVFLSAFISATLVPVGSEPILFGYITVNPHLYWIAILIATIGNTCGGMFDWWLGLLAHSKLKSLKGPQNGRVKAWLEQHGPKVLLLILATRFGGSFVLSSWMVAPCMGTLFDLYVFWEASALPHHDMVAHSSAR